MFVTFIALASLLQGQTPAHPSAGQVISKMLAHYARPDSAAGKIKLTVSAEGESSELGTLVQFEKPSLIYVRQASAKSSPVWLIVSDGKHFSYNIPTNLSAPKDDRLMEAVVQNGLVNTAPDIYGIAAQTLKDRSLPLDLVFGRKEEMAFRRTQWATHKYLGDEDVRGQQTHVVGGDWREYGKALVSGTYRMWITDAGDLLRYEEQGKVGIPDPRFGGQMVAHTITSNWDVDLKINVPTDQSLYKLP